MEEEKKKLIFYLYFQHISPCFYSNLDAELNSTSNEYPLNILLMDSTTQKKEIPEKCDDDVIIMFFQVFIFLGVEGPIKTMSSGYSLDAEFNSTSNKLS